VILLKRVLTGRTLRSATRRSKVFLGLLSQLRAIVFDPRSGPALVRLTAEARHDFIASSDKVMVAAEDRDGGPMSAVLLKIARLAEWLAKISDETIPGTQRTSLLLQGRAKANRNNTTGHAREPSHPTVRRGPI
jgi:hypothetical protein